MSARPVVELPAELVEQLAEALVSVPSSSRRSRRRAEPVPRLAFRVGEAAEVLGLSRDFFAEHVASELKWVRRGAVKVVSRAELERWLERNAARTLDDEDEGR